MRSPLIHRAFSHLPPVAQEYVRRQADAARMRAQVKRSKAAAAALSEAGVAGLEQIDFNHLLHHLRGRELSNLPKGVGNFVSVGCAGTWYFEWIEKCCGPVGKHVGIEYYTPMPEGLPTNVEWIANTAGDMSLIADGTGDILFSGQNLEHLWPQDVAAFLRESHRVLKEGGLLVVDSPNRLVTQKLTWSHPEHTVEFTPDEARELIELSGFEVTAVRGMWLCADKVGATIPPLDELVPAGNWSVKRRVKDAAKHPDESFSWWIEARKTNSVPDVARTLQRALEIFRNAWGQRTNRLLTIVGKRSSQNGVDWIESANMPGVLMYGPYMPLPAGDYTVSFQVRTRADQQKGGALPMRFDVISGAGTELAVKTLDTPQIGPDGLVTIDLDFHLNDMTFGVQFRAIANESFPVAVRRAVRLKASDPLFAVALDPLP